MNCSKDSDVTNDLLTYICLAQFTMHDDSHVVVTRRVSPKKDSQGTYYTWVFTHGLVKVRTDISGNCLSD